MASMTPEMARILEIAKRRRTNPLTLTALRQKSGLPSEGFDRAIDALISAGRFIFRPPTRGELWVSPESRRMTAVARALRRRNLMPHDNHPQFDILDEIVWGLSRNKNARQIVGLLTARIDRRNPRTRLDAILEGDGASISPFRNMIAEADEF